MTKATAKRKAAAQSDLVALCRGQHAGLYDSAGRLRRIVDHPANAQLLGAGTEVDVVRAANVTLDADDAMAVVHAGQGGAASRIATARATLGSGGSVGLIEWRVEAGFDHVVTSEDGRTIHRLARTPSAPR